MPLTRTRGGQLGVVAEGFGGGSADRTQVVVNNYGSEAATVDRQRLPDGRELIEVTVGRSIAQGRFDSQMGARFGSKPQARKYA